MIVVARHDLPTIDGASIDVPMTAAPMTAVPTTVRTGSDHESAPAERPAAPTAESGGSPIPAGERSQ